MAIALCLAFTWNASVMIQRGPRAAGLGVTLVPVAGLWMWALGVVGWSTFGSLGPFGGFDRGGSFWKGLLIVAACGVFAVITPRAAAYLASAGSLALGVFATFLAMGVQVYPNTVEWWNWVLYISSRPVMGAAALVSVAIGYLMIKNTIAADLARRSSGLTARITTLTKTRAEIVDSAAAELRRLERDLHDGAQARLVALGINLRVAEKLVRASPDAAAPPPPPADAPKCAKGHVIACPNARLGTLANGPECVNGHARAFIY